MNQCHLRNGKSSYPVCQRRNTFFANTFIMFIQSFPSSTETNFGTTGPPCKLMSPPPLSPPSHQNWLRQKFGSGGPPKLLLLSMFALVAQYSDPDDIGQSTRDSSVQHTSYMADVQTLLSRPGSCSSIHTLLKYWVTLTIEQAFVSSRMSTCQALLLLAYRAIGLSTFYVFVYHHVLNYPQAD
jgi:Fungal specific transcription factor domain